MLLAPLLMIINFAAPPSISLDIYGPPSENSQAYEFRPMRQPPVYVTFISSDLVLIGERSVDRSIFADELVRLLNQDEQDGDGFIILRVDRSADFGSVTDFLVEIGAKGIDRVGLVYFTNLQKRTPDEQD